MSRIGTLRWAWLMAFSVAAPAVAAPVDYQRDVWPLLKAKCVSCHGPLRQKAGLRLDAGRLIHQGGKDGPVISTMPGKSAQSELLARVQSADLDKRMPPTGAPLAADQVVLLREWIEQGAQFPKDEIVGATPQEHWSFQTVKRPAVPQVIDTRWPLNDIDRFVLARLEAKGWRPNPQAEPRVLARRAHLDLIGLPPAPAEAQAFADAPGGEAFSKMVARLLANPAHGERYARHWLDVVRYADSNGYERDGAKPEVWRYRDYVIRALNSDKPFDRFVREQIAGDELADANADSVTATGLHRLGPWDDEPADFAVDRYDQLDDISNTVGQAFWGLTIGCARCHDHKFDPLSHRDYYSLVAVFNPLQRPQSGRSELARPAAPPVLAAQIAARDQQAAREQAAMTALRAEFQKTFLAGGASKLPAAVTSAFAVEEKQRSAEQKKLVQENQSKLDAELAIAAPVELKSKLAAHELVIVRLRQQTPDVPLGYFMVENGPRAPDTRILLRGNPGTPGEVVGPAVPVILARTPPTFLAPDTHTTRRRLSLAQWMTERENPLLARVIVNRVWQWHFGEGLVRTPNDFGLIGERPTHPELLDFLAHWFVHDAKWSLKALHQFICTSRTYQMSSARNETYAAVDPENRLLWRQSSRRLEVEAIRDSMLHVSGRLDARLYGPPMYPFIPAEALANHADKTSIWPAYDEAAASRRTVYAFIKRSLLVPMIEVFDLCDTTRSAPRRAVTTVPTQALTLYNGELVRRQAQHFADRLLREAGTDDRRQIERAWLLALARPPREAEVQAAVAFLAQERAQAVAAKATEADARRQALAQLCRVMFNLNEFVYTE
ncbi:MAG: DUF1553 domain-containing protein [Pedosphaera sp.]|nr:DUF1553 domain-containing protein [Pedosphaera sp.]MSU44308.1 DUF1553 domain-containing protein [Pedosphaera sp.]